MILLALPPMVAALIAFSAIILALTLMLLFAKAQLIPSGDVSISINGEKDLSTKPGSTLLSTLSMVEK